MKPYMFIAVLGAVGISVSGNCFGGEYTLTRAVVACGGGTCSGGLYAVSSTVGQGIAGQSVGSGHIGGWGYWPDLSGARPSLRIEKSGSDFLLAWEDFAANYKLQKSLDLTPGSWAEVFAQRFWVGDEMMVTVPYDPVGKKNFFRVESP